MTVTVLSRMAKKEEEAVASLRTTVEKQTLPDSEKKKAKGKEFPYGTAVWLSIDNAFGVVVATSDPERFPVGATHDLADFLTAPFCGVIEICSVE